MTHLGYSLSSEEHQPGSLVHNAECAEAAKRFEDAVKTLRQEDVAESIVCGPDPEPYIKKQIGKFERAGYDHIYLHQIGRDQEGFFKFFERELAPALS